MAKIRISLSAVNPDNLPDDKKEVVTLTVSRPGENDIGIKLRDFFEWVKDKAAEGTGVTITAKTNGGEEKKFYIDGDGGDIIYRVK